MYTDKPKRMFSIPNFSLIENEEEFTSRQNKSISFSEENSDTFKNHLNVLQHTARNMFEDLKTPRFLSDNNLAFVDHAEDLNLGMTDEYTCEKEQIRRVKSINCENTVKINSIGVFNDLRLETNPTHDTVYKESCSQKFACGCLLF